MRHRAASALPFLASLLLTGTPAAAQSDRIATGARTPLQQTIRTWRQAHDVAILRELTDFVAIPNIATDVANIRRNAAHLVTLLESRGFRTQLLEASGGPPAVFGELRVPGATRTVMFYAHYDGQPVDPAQWATPPWTPVLRDKALTEGGREIAAPTTPGAVDGEWRLYGRSAADDKGPIIAMLAALDALRVASTQPSVNLKVFFEGEEEAGSEHLRDMLSRYRDRLGADLWLFGDGPVHQSRRQQIVFGARGVLPVQFTIYGPIRGLHSGHYGNWIYNPIALAANLVASMRDDEGQIKIAGFADDIVPISSAERAAIEAAPAIEAALQDELQVGGTEGGGVPLGERVMLPALNLRGIQGGAVGAVSSNTIPTEATVSIDFRLVPNQTVARVKALFESHLERQGYYVVDHVPTADERRHHAKIAKVAWEPGYAATKTRMDRPASQAVAHAAEQALGAPPVIVPLLGGSLPMYVFDEVLHAPLVIVPIVNHDNNQHAANENLRLQNLWDGIELYAGMLAALGPLLQDLGR